MFFSFTGRSPRSPPPAEQSQRPGRPSHPPRQTSFGKRHSSFDTPREFPFPASNSHPVASSSSRSHTRLPERENPSPPPLPGSSAQPNLQDKIAYSSPKINGHSTSTQGLPATSVPDPASPSNTLSMNSGTELHNLCQHQDSTVGCQWCSDNLRPLLLQHRQPSSLSSSSVRSPTLIPYGTGEMGGTDARILHAPIPRRLSSTDSLPLPTQTPITTLDQRRMGTLLEGVPDIPLKDRLAPEAVDSYDSSSTTLTSTITNTSRVLSPPPSGDDAPTVSKPPARSSLSPQTDSGGTSLLSDGSEPSGPDSRRSWDSTAFLSTSGSSSVRTSRSSVSFPPPTPPTIHTPPPPPSNGTPGGETIPGQAARMRAPHEPFLSHGPAPEECYISVETMENEYRLSARLPGFQQDCITLSTRRRRILHVVADSWGTNGGHFERRISFGYDADLSHVRAEFDGEYLRVIIPRQMPQGWYTPRGLD